MPTGRRSLAATLGGPLLLVACSTSETLAPDVASPRPDPTTSVVASPSATTPASASATPAAPTFTVWTYPVPAGSGPHDVAPAVDGGVWYTAQGSSELGWLDPANGAVREIPLGPGSAPHGVIVGPDGTPWITDGGLNAIVNVDPMTDRVTRYPLPSTAPDANLNTAAFDGDGVLWFTGQTGYFGRLDPASGEMQVFNAPRGMGPYGITATPDGDIYYSSLAGSYLGEVDRESGDVRVINPPTTGAGLRRTWADSRGRIWVSEWNAGQVGRYNPANRTWKEWPLPEPGAQAYAVYVDDTDAVWLTDFTSQAILRFDPVTETFMSFPADSQPANVRQLLGRPGELWGAESAADQLVVIRTD